MHRTAQAHKFRVLPTPISPPPPYWVADGGAHHAPLPVHGGPHLPTRPAIVPMPPPCLSIGGGRGQRWQAGGGLAGEAGRYHPPKELI